MEYLCLVFLSKARAVLWYLSVRWGLLMGSCTWGHASLQGKKWDNENFKTHLTGPRYYDTVKLPKRPRVDKFNELGRSFLFLLCFWTTGIQQPRGTSLLSPHINGPEEQWHTVKIPDWTGTPQHRGWDQPWHPRCPSRRNETQPHLTHILDQQRGVPFGVPWNEGCHGWFGSPGAWLGAAAAISRACSLPDPYI